MVKETEKGQVSGTAASFAHVWQSERLVFRAIEDDNEDKTFLWKHIDNDPVIATLGFGRLCAPSTKSSLAQSVNSNSILRVCFCLKPAAEDAAAAADQRLAPIGILNMWPKYHAHNRGGEISVSVSAPFRGKGYGGEAINWALDWGFQRGNLHCISLAAFDFNPGALALYRKLGFVEEGRNRDAVYFERKWHDIILFSILEGEWEQLRALGKDGGSR
ncbi:acyl-CoA N-acyltransferase [Lasiosphaeria miniovina]|uniref:Acyl-CoA N-acyltransferase n=1 Tax=Lasiosphaeria miniovina TaxID=1954250 RepID=A0AA40B6U0_9PEZI|nr:acyl-CoA N-acyltransferase [Lasiosphaeria miniovina]KAK0728664.1 acyl-CoA N-acyltransferase [Lasiosphaeria miniovina]